MRIVFNTDQIHLHGGIEKVMTDLMDDFELRKQMGQKAREAMQNYKSSYIMNVWNKLFQKIKESK